MTLVVPCYNEEGRLDTAALELLARSMRLVLVDDGSRDGTRALCDAVAARSASVEVLALDQNRGKAEAVRQGMLRAVRRGDAMVGFADADMATPPEELLRLGATLEGDGALSVVMGSRVSRAGARVERSPMRHYAGRLFATVAATMLEAPFYDTQCGAKFFRAGAPLARALDEPFLSKWAFDVELLARLLIGSDDVAGVPFDAMLEVPLRRWADVGGSKLRASALPGVAADVARVMADIRRRRHTSRLRRK